MPAVERRGRAVVLNLANLHFSSIRHGSGPTHRGRYDLVPGR